MAQSSLMPRARSPLVLALTLALVCAATVATAQSQSTHTSEPVQTAPSTLAPIIVHSPSSSLTAPTVSKARTAIERTPGGVALVPDTAWTDTQSATIKDMLDFTPGVFAQPKWGEDSRLSIRGSGLSRYYHMRGIALYQDGVPLNNADGSADFQWIDPTAYRYTEVYKGANAWRYGASTLGGAINFVTPTGQDAAPFQGRIDAGSFGWRRLQASNGFAGERLDGFITASWQEQDGFRDHSGGHALRASGNVGLRVSEQLETRFYLTGVRVRQAIPGSVSRKQALDDPRRAASANEEGDWRRDVNGFRLSNRTSFVAGQNRFELGGWYAQSQLNHPIYQYLDNTYRDYGAYGRMENTATLLGHANTLTLGMTWSAGTVAARNYENVTGHRGTKLSQTDDTSNNILIYGDNAFDIRPGLSLLTGLQYLRATRKRDDRYNEGLPTIRSGDKTYDFFNPKLGLLWQVHDDWQIYTNMSRSAEPPTFGDMSFATANDLDRLKPQRATTYEIGTRGQAGDLAWDVSLYHARLRHEFQCISAPWNICDQTRNLDRTIHQGIEAGLQWTAARGLFSSGAQTDSLHVNVAYTFSDFYFDNDEQWHRNQLPGVPKHYLRAELLYRHPSGFYIGPNIEWVPQAYFADNANSLKTASYTLLGMRAGWKGDRYTLFIEGRNLGNRRYIASTSITDRANPDAALFEPGTGRAVFAGLQFDY